MFLSVKQYDYVALRAEWQLKNPSHRVFTL
jgi:hypothetical protein